MEQEINISEHLQSDGKELVQEEEEEAIEHAVELLDQVLDNIWNIGSKVK
jgi:hypothetical protein